MVKLSSHEERGDATRWVTEALKMLPVFRNARCQHGLIFTGRPRWQRFPGLVLLYERPLTANKRAPRNCCAPRRSTIHEQSCHSSARWLPLVYFVHGNCFSCLRSGRVIRSKTSIYHPEFKLLPDKPGLSLFPVQSILPTCFPTLTFPLDCLPRPPTDTLRDRFHPVAELQRRSCSVYRSVWHAPAKAHAYRRAEVILTPLTRENVHTQCALYLRGLASRAS